MSDVDGAVAQWCEDTGTEVGSPMAHEATALVADHDGDVRAILLTAASLWLYDVNFSPESGLRLTEVGWVTVVLAAARDYVMVINGVVDFDEFRTRLVGVFDSANLAATTALALLPETRTFQALELKVCDYLTLPKHKDWAVPQEHMREARLWCMNTAPGYEWFEAGAVGWVLYRTGSK